MSCMRALHQRLAWPNLLVVLLKHFGDSAPRPCQMFTRIFSLLAYEDNFPTCGFWRRHDVRKHDTRSSVWFCKFTRSHLIESSKKLQSLGKRLVILLWFVGYVRFLRGEMGDRDKWKDLKFLALQRSTRWTIVTVHFYCVVQSCNYMFYTQ